MATKTTTTKKAPAKAEKASNFEATIFDSKGEKAGTMQLPENLFGLPWNADLMHQVVTSMQSNARHSIAHTKDRGEVRGGGRKPWQQKGTGRARHGSSRSPIWVGGGVTHGPRAEKDYSKKVNRQARQKALLVALSRKYKDGEIIFVDSLEIAVPKTKEARGILASLGKAGLGYKKHNNALVALPAAHAPTLKSFANFNNLEAVIVANLNPVDVLKHKYLVIADPKSAIETLSKKKVVKSEK